MKKFKLTLACMVLAIAGCAEEIVEDSDINNGGASNPSETNPTDVDPYPVDPNIAVPTSEPYQGTIFIDPDILTSSDPTTYVSITSAGQGQRNVFDRRINAYRNTNVFLFNASYSNGSVIEMRINAEFGNEAAALAQAQKYAIEVGRLPAMLRANVQDVVVHQGTELFGGGGNSILIHTGQTVLYENDGILEETLLHEAAHTSLQAHGLTAGWQAAQASDPFFISTYARDNPTREDVAESVLLYLAARYKTDRISPTTLSTINYTIRARMEYFDNQGFDVFPFE